MKKILAFSFVALLVFSACSISFDSGRDSSDVEEAVSLPDEEVVVEESVEDKDSEEDVEKEDVSSKKSSDDEKQVLVDRGDVPLSDIQLIKKYYQLIEDGKLEDAFAMRFNTSVTYKTFKGWYSRVNDTYAYNFEEISPKRYKFTVELDEVGGVEETYSVVTEVKDNGFLKNISSTKVWDNYTPKVSTKVVDGHTNLYLTLNGVEKFLRRVVDPNDPNVLLVQNLYDYYITPNEKYLVYQLRGWELGEIYVFDIDKGTHVFEFIGPASDYGFTYDYENFYICLEDGLHGGVANVYSVGGNGAIVSHRELVSSNVRLVSCDGYNSTSNTYSYTIVLNPAYSDVSVRRTYHFNTGIID